MQKTVVKCQMIDFQSNNINNKSKILLQKNQRFCVFVPFIIMVVIRKQNSEYGENYVILRVFQHLNFFLK